MKKYVIGIIVSIVLPASIAGSPGGFGGATEMTQLLNNVQLAQQTVQSMDQLNQLITSVQHSQQQLKNLISAPSMQWGQISSELNQLAQTVAKGQAVGYSVGNIEQKFNTVYSKTPTTGNYGEQARNLNHTSMDSIRASLDAGGAQADMFVTEQGTMEAIQQMGASAPGQLQAAQVGIMVAGQQVQQLQKMRQLMMAQNQAQNAVMMKAEKKELDTQAALDSFYKPYEKTTNNWNSKGGSR